MAPDLRPRNASHHGYSPQQHPRPDYSDATLLRRLLLILLFGVLVFSLGHAMVANHFFSGGTLNNHQGHTVGP